jgi:hypothetical protein
MIISIEVCLRTLFTFGALLGIHAIADGRELRELRLSAGEVALLQEIGRIQSASGSKTTLLAGKGLARVAQPSSGGGVTITVDDAEWKAIDQSMALLPKQHACRIAEKILSQADSSKYSSPASKRLFDRLFANADRRC